MRELYFLIAIGEDGRMETISITLREGLDFLDSDVEEEFGPFYILETA